MEEYTNDILQLTKLADIDTTPYGTDLKTIVYHPVDSKKIISVVDNNFVLWDLTNDGPQVSKPLVVSSSSNLIPRLSIHQVHCQY